MHSCIYEGRVAHCRYEPVVHKFWYRLYMAYLDLDELRDDPHLRSLVPKRRFSAAGFLPEIIFAVGMGRLMKAFGTWCSSARELADRSDPFADSTAALRLLLQPVEFVLLLRRDGYAGGVDCGGGEQYAVARAASLRAVRTEPVRRTRNGWAVGNALLLAREGVSRLALHGYGLPISLGTECSWRATQGAFGEPPAGSTHV